MARRKIIGLNGPYVLDINDLVKSVAYECAIDAVTVEYVLRRFAAEGIKFLTVTLPKISKAVIFSLEEGYFIRPTDFSWKGKHLVILRSHTEKIFSSGGFVLDAPDALSIKLIRQFCEYFYKLSLDPSNTELVKAENKFEALDDTVPSIDGYDSSFVDQLRKDFETKYPSISRASVHDILTCNPPRPGSGTFAGADFQSSGYDGNWYTRRYADFRAPRKWGEYGYARRYSYHVDPSTVVREPELSEVLFVPKDSRGPRTIVREPFLSLAFQMSYFDFMSHNLEKSTAFRVNFQDQGVNQRLARESSLDRTLATIDLKDASDSVSFAVIKHIFRHSPGVLHFILNRTPSTELPSGKVRTLRKLAGMGSGLTFPTMSLLCHLAITRTIVNRTGRRYESVAREVYIYGDDIIVPTKYLPMAYAALERVNLTVNKQKSFSKGFFRESCGGDYYQGQDVGFVRVKLSSAKLEIVGQKLVVSGPLALKTLDAHAAELVKNGINQTADLIYKVLEKATGKLPFKANDCNVIARYSFGLPKEYFSSGGVYKGIRCITASPLEEEVSNEAFFLAQALKGSKRPCWKDILFPSLSIDHSRIAVPRTQRYRRGYVNPLALA